MFEFYGTILNVSDTKSDGYRVLRLRMNTGPEMDLLLPPVVAAADGVPGAGDQVAIDAHTISGAERLWRWSHISLVAHNVRDQQPTARTSASR